MKIQPLSICTLLHLLAFAYTVSYDDFAFPINQSPLHNYTRLTEINNHCKSFISSASKLQSNHNLASRLKTELSFFNGDWEQDSREHGATLMPFDDSDMPLALFSSYFSPLKLVSFEVQNVTTSSGPHQPENTVSISGVLSIGITRNTTLIPETGLKFHKIPGMSALRVDFEGLYLETQENGGERVVCLLGDSVFPFEKVPKRYSDGYVTTYFDVEETLSILPHENIMLVLKYPKHFSLSSTRIIGEMTSLSEDSEYDYFDKVHITSYSGIFPESCFNDSDEFVFDSFDRNPAILEDGVNKFNNSEFCKILKYFEHEEYRVMPDLKLDGQYWWQNNVGPFLLGNEIQVADRNNEILRIMMQKIRCETDKVSGVLRLYPSTIEPQVAARRTGLSTLTLIVKGTWNSSTGLLSMTGCLGPNLEKCDSGVILYFPKYFSSKQRSVISGSIFSLKNATYAFHPVFIGVEMISPGLYDGGFYSSNYLSYNYSKSDLAVKFRERIQEPHLITYIRESIFKYPTLGEEKDGIFNVSNRLSDDLKIGTFSSLETFVRLEVMSLGPLFTTNDTQFYQVYDHEALNVALNLLLIEKPDEIREESYGHVSKLYLEGVYDHRVGKLYLIGCRKVDFDHVDLERGLDCLIEVTIEYSPLNTRWLINPTAKVTIVSQREREDSYHFKTIHLHTFMIRDKDHEKNVIFRKIFEGYFRVFLILVYIAHMLNQIKNMKKYNESVPYISLVMLGVWIIGYGITLIYSKEIVIKSSESTNYRNQPYNHQRYTRYLNNLDYCARFLVLVSMFLMGWIARIVLKARKLLGEKGKPSPSEKTVIMVSLTVFVCYFLLSIITGGIYIYLYEATFTKEVYIKLIMQVFSSLVHDIQDFYLLPQIIAFRIWKPRFSGHLYKNFIAGLLIPFLIQFVYEITRDPVGYPA